MLKHKAYQLRLTKTVKILQLGYVAFVPSLPGCHTQGESLEETERNIQEAIEVYLESLKAHGEPLPKEIRGFQGTVQVLMPA